MTERSVDKKTQVRSTEEALKLIDLLVKQDILTKHETNLLREALAQSRSDEEQPAQQEPVAWIDICEKGQMSGLRYWSEPDNRHEVPLYTSPPAQQQEPVATLDDLEQEIYENTREFVSRNVMEWMLKRYYTPPASKPWVGLTDEQVWACLPPEPDDLAFARAIEAKLKAKNSL